MAQLLFKLSSMALGEAWSKKCVFKFLVYGTDFAGLAELVDAGLSGGLFNKDPEFSIAHGRTNDKLRGSHTYISLSSLASTLL